MKILFYINTLGRGGAERAICNTASYFAEHGWDTILLTSFRVEHEYIYSDKIHRMSIEDNQIIQSRLKRNLSRIRAIRELCRCEKVDVAVSFMQEANFRIVSALAGMHIKTIISVRNDPKEEYKGIIGRMVGKGLLPCADGAVFQTQEAKAWFPKKLQSKGKVIYNVVDEKFYNTRYIGGMDIVSCGRSVPQKNQALLIRAFQKIIGRFPHLHLCIYGPERTDTRLADLIEGLHLQKKVFLMGSREDIPAVLSRAKIFILSSDYEGMPNALMEAMAVGVPSISTDCPCGGPRELFGEDLAEMLVPVGDEDALATKMEELLINEKKRIEIGIKMRKRAEKFRTGKIGKEWEDYVCSICRE